MHIFVPKVVKFYSSIFLEFSKDCHLGFALCLMESIFIGIYYYLSIYLVDTLHFDLPTSGIIISCYGIGAIFGGILGGKLSDWSSPGAVSTYSLFIQAIAYFIFSQATSPILLMINVFVLGIASYGFITSNYLFVLEKCVNGENQRLKAISILSMSANLGLGLSAVILGGMLSLGFHRVFLIASIFVCVIATLSAYYELTIKRMKSNHTIQNAQTTINTNIFVASDNSIFMMALLCVFLIGMIITQLGATYTIYVKEIFPLYGLKAVTLLFALNSFIVVLASTLVCDFIKEYNKLLVLGIGAFLIGFGLLILILSQWFVIAIISCVIYTIGEMMFFPVAQLLCYQSGHKHKKGSSLGIYRVVYASSRVFGPTVGSWIYYQLGGNMLWLICGIVGITCMVFCTLLNSWKLTGNTTMFESL